MSLNGSVIWRNELVSLGFEPLDLHNFISVLSTDEVEHIISLENVRRFPSETQCFFGVKSGTIEEFAFQSVKMVLSPALQSLMRQPQPNSCMLAYDFSTFVQHRNTWILDKNDVASSLARLREVISSELVPIYRNCRTYAALLDLLASNHRLYRWSSVNSVARASYVVALARLLHHKQLAAMKLLEPYRERIEQDLGDFRARTLEGLVSILWESWNKKPT